MPFSTERLQYTDTLTQKQYNFTQAYCTNGFNIEKAMLQAGYTDNTARTQGYLLVQQPTVKNVINKALAAKEEAIISRLGMCIYWRAKKLKHIIDIYIPDDDHELANTNKVRIGLDAIKEVNKMCGDTAISNKINFNVNTDARIRDATKAYEEY